LNQVPSENATKD